MHGKCDEAFQNHVELFRFSHQRLRGVSSSGALYLNINLAEILKK
jgi:hypothetical protein